MLRKQAGTHRRTLDSESYLLKLEYTARVLAFWTTSISAMISGLHPSLLLPVMASVHGEPSAQRFGSLTVGEKLEHDWSQ